MLIKKDTIYIYDHIQGVRDKFYILIFLLFFRLVGGIYVNWASFESLDPPSFTCAMTERMDDWSTPESWKRMTCIMMIHAGQQNKEITVTAQCSLNTVKTIRHELENSDGDYEAVARKKQHNRRPECICTAEFLEDLQKNVLEDQGIGIRVLSRELDVSASAMKLAFSEGLRYYSYKRR